MSGVDAADDSFWQEEADAWRLIEQARVSAGAGDRRALASVATRLWRKTKVPVNVLVGLGDTVAAELDGLCDEAAPPPQVLRIATTVGLEARLRLAADVLDALWPTPRRLAALLLVTGGDVVHQRMVRLDELAEQALAAPSLAVRPRLLRLVVSSVLGCTRPGTGARVLAALHEVGALDADTVEGAFTRDTAVAERRSLGDAVFDADQPVGTEGFRAALRDLYDEVVWRLTAAPNPDDWNVTPTSPPPRGLRFVLRGLDLSAGRLAAEPGLDPTDRYVGEIVAHLCAAELTDEERSELAQLLLQLPDAERRTAMEYQPLLAPALGHTGEPQRPYVSMVPGVAPEGDDGRSARYRGTQLQTTDAVAAALARVPKVWRVINDHHGEFARIARKNLCGYLYLSTRDGQTWDLGVEEEIAGVVEVEPAPGEVDLVEQALAAQPEVVRARHADVDWYRVSVARPLRPDEMLARFIDALAAAHRASVQRRPAPRWPQPLDPETLLALAAEIDPMMAEHGFAPLKVDLAKNRAALRNVFPGFYRYGGEQLVQVVALSPGSGETSDGADGWVSLEGTVTVGLRVQAVKSSDPTAFINDVNGRQYVGGVNVGQWMKHGVPPSAAGLASALLETCLPWFADRGSRVAIVSHWMRNPGSHAPWSLWEKVEMAALWGMRDEASALLRTGYLEEPQHAEKFTAVAERFGLPTDWESLAAPKAPPPGQGT